MTEDRLEALLLLRCHREHCPICQTTCPAHFAKKASLSQTTQLRSVAEIAEVVVLIVISAAFCSVSYIHI